MATDKEIVPWEEQEATGLAKIEATPELLQQAYEAIMEGKLPPEIGDPNITSRLILERIRLGTLDESLDPIESLPNWAREYEDVSVAIFGFHLNPSGFEREEYALDEDGNERRDSYAVCEIAPVDTGEIVTVQTGGKNVLVQLVKAWEEDRFPFTAKLVKRKTSTPGRHTLWLVKAD